MINLYFCIKQTSYQLETDQDWNLASTHIQVVSPALRGKIQGVSLSSCAGARQQEVLLS